MYYFMKTQHNGCKVIPIRIHISFGKKFKHLKNNDISDISYYYFDTKYAKLFKDNRFCSGIY